MTSRVTPGWSWTMEMRFFASRLKRRLLPTLGRPTMATVRFIQNEFSRRKRRRRRKITSQPSCPSRDELLLFPALHKPLDAIASLDQLLVARGEAGADVALPVFAEGDARDDSDFFFFQQADGEFFF